MTMTSDSRVPAGARAGDSPVPTSTRATDRLGDGPRRLALPAGAAGRRGAAADAGRGRRAVAGQRTRSGVPLTFRSGGTSLSGQGVTDGVLVDTRAALPRDRGARRRRPGAGAARRDGARGQRPPGPARPQARPRPGQRDRLHDRRRRRQQLQRHGLRHRAEHLPHAGVARPRAAERHRRRHRRADADERLRTLEPELYAGPGAAARPGPRQRRSRSRTHRARCSRSRTRWATASTPSSTTTARSTSCPPRRRQRGHARLRRRGDLPHRAGAPARRDRPADLRRPRPRPPARCPTLVDAGLGDHRAARRHLACGSAQTRPAAPTAELRALDGATTTPPCWSSTRRRPPRSWPTRVAGRAPRPRRRCRSPARPAHAPTPRDPGGAVAHPQGPLHRGRRRPPVRARPRCSRTSPSRSPAAARPCDEPAPSCSTGTATSDSVIFGHAKDGNIHFMLNERFDDPATLDRYRPVHRRHGRPRARPRRHAQGRARHRPDHGAVRAPPVRRRAVRGDARDQAAARPARHAQPRRRCSTTTRRRTCSTSSRRRPSRPRSTAASSAATASRSARARTSPPRPRQRIVLRREMAARARRRRPDLLARARGRLRLRRDRHLRRRRHVPDRLPGLIDTGDLVRRLRGEQARAGRQRGAGDGGRRHWAGCHAAPARRPDGGRRRCPPALPARRPPPGRALLGADIVPAVDAATCRAAAAPRRRPPGGRRPTRSTSRPASRHDVRPGRRRRRASRPRS